MSKLAAAAVLAIGCSAAADSRPPAPAPDYQAHIAALRKHLRARQLGDLEIRIEAPFVVVGTGTADELARHAQTVRWAADILERDFFAKRPAKILDIYLFGDAASYERGVKLLTGSEPTTPYGFYSRAHDGLFMNIATGGGTLVHEIVHPYVEADFPGAPAWLNEGLGSLFEQCAERTGHIVGLPNWRLTGLQRALRGPGVRSFQALTGLDTGAFYADDSGVNYAQSRYLLFYLQDHGKLRDFYSAFRAASAKDPTGYATLVTTLGESDMAAFQTKWERYVKRLTFP